MLSSSFWIHSNWSLVTALLALPIEHTEMTVPVPASPFPGQSLPLDSQSRASQVLRRLGLICAKAGTHGNLSGGSGTPSATQLLPALSQQKSCATGTVTGSVDSLHTKSHSGKASPPEFYLRMSFQSTVPVDADQISLLYPLMPSKF